MSDLIQYEVTRTAPLNLQEGEVELFNSSSKLKTKGCIM